MSTSRLGQWCLALLTCATLGCKVQQPAATSTLHSEEGGASEGASSNCKCDDGACIKRGIANYEEEMLWCLAALAVEAAVPENGGTAVKVGKCAVASGMTVRDVVTRIIECKEVAEHKDDIVGVLKNCALGGTASGVQFTQQVAECANIEAGSAITGCSLTILDGTVKLGQNVMCLGSDIAQIREQQAVIGRALNAAPPLVRPTVPNSVEDCSARRSSNSIRLAQFCASKDWGVTWFNSSIRSECGGCCSDNMSGYQGNYSGCADVDPNSSEFSNYIQDCTQRCYDIRGGT